MGTGEGGRGGGSLRTISETRARLRINVEHAIKV